MKLISKIIEELCEDTDLAVVLRKVKLLAHRLNSDELLAWVTHEVEGYPSTVNVPVYRQIPMSIIADFNSFRFMIRNKDVTSLLDSDLIHDLRSSISSVEDLIQKGGGQIDMTHIASSLNGFYQGAACFSATGRLSSNTLKSVLDNIRSRAMDLVVQIDNKIPAASEITYETNSNFPPEVAQMTNIITQTNVYGHQTNVNNSGHGAKIETNVATNTVPGDTTNLIQALTQVIKDEDTAKELAEVVTSDTANGIENADGWVATNFARIKKFAGSVSLATISKLIADVIAAHI